MARSYRSKKVHGFISQVTIALVMCVAACGAWVYLSPRVQAYRAKAVVRNACVQAMREQVRKGTHPEWETELLTRLEALGLPAEAVAYEVETSEICETDDCSCTGTVEFGIETPWPLLSSLIPSIRAQHSNHRVTVQVTYR